MKYKNAKVTERANKKPLRIYQRAYDTNTSHRWLNPQEPGLKRDDVDHSTTLAACSKPNCSNIRPLLKCCYTASQECEGYQVDQHWNYSKSEALRRSLPTCFVKGLGRIVLCLARGAPTYLVYILSACIMDSHCVVVYVFA